MADLEDGFGLSQEEHFALKGLHRKRYEEELRTSKGFLQCLFWYTGFSHPTQKPTAEGWAPGVSTPGGVSSAVESTAIFYKQLYI